MTSISRRLRDEYVEEDGYGWQDNGYSDWREVSSKSYVYSSNSRMHTGYSRDGSKYKTSVENQ